MTQGAGRYSCAVLLACAGLAISSCAGSAGHSDTRPFAAADELAAEAIQRVCGILQTCCNDAQFLYDEQGCRAFHTQNITQYFYRQTFLGATLDPQAAKRCLDSIGSISDGCPLDRSNGYLTGACDWVFKGTVPLGGECDSGHGCATTPDAPLLCDLPFDAKSGRSVEPGVCITNPSPVPTLSIAGQACSSTCIGDDPCFDASSCNTSDGLFCNW